MSTIKGDRVEIDRLVADIKTVRERGIAGISPDAVPALMEALATRNPGVASNVRLHDLEELLAAAANQLDDHDKEGIRLALGLGGLSGNSADRRSRFAAHYDRGSETVRRPKGLEDQAFTRLARAILTSLKDELAANSSARPGQHTTDSISPATGEDTSVAPLPGTHAYLELHPAEPTLTSRARAQFAIDGLELDLRYFIDRFLLGRLAPAEVFGRAVATRLSARQASLDISESGSLLQYLHPQEGFDALLRHADALLPELADVLQANLVAFENFIPLRNRVMRGRPLQPDDLDRADVFVRAFPAVLFPRTAEALVRLSSDAGWQPRPRTGSVSPDLVLHNLPEPDFDETGLLGREELVANIVKLVKRQREPITLIGEGGIGKTALAVEVCYRLIDDLEPVFEAVLWTSLKTEKLTRGGVQEISTALRDIEGITQALGQAIDNSFEGNVEELVALVGERTILIVIDNLETVQGDEIVELYDRLPRSVTFLFTSRVGVGKLERPVHVGPLGAPSAELLFRKLASASQAVELTGLTDDEVRVDVSRLRYSPLAIRWYILSVEAGKSPDAVLRDQVELLEFCVANVIEALDDEDRCLLEILRILDRPVSDDELAVISDMDIDTLRRGAQQLTQRSLLVRALRPGFDQTEFITLSSTARDFLPAVPESELIEDVMRREAAYSQDRENERRWVADHGRYFDPNVIFERSSADAPLAYLLRRALRENKSSQPDAATATIARVRTIDRSYFEIDRIEAFFASTRRETARATMLYRSALSYCDSDEERCWVGYFYSAHLARMVVDIPAAIGVAEETHKFYNTYDTAHHLGNFYSWDGRFEEAEQLLIWSLERSPTKEFTLKATTSLIECYRQWSSAGLRTGFTAASLDHALRGIETGVERYDAGGSDDRLLRAIVESAVTAIHLVQEVAIVAGDERRLADALQRLADDPQFVAHASWRSLELQASALPDALRSRVAPGVNLDAVQEGRLVGSIVWMDAKDHKFGFIAHPGFPENVFFHAGSLIRPTRMHDLSIGAVVGFTPTATANGRDEALDVIAVASDVTADSPRS